MKMQSIKTKQLLLPKWLFKNKPKPKTSQQLTILLAEDKKTRQAILRRLAQKHSLLGWGKVC